MEIPLYWAPESLFLANIHHGLSLTFSFRQLSITSFLDIDTPVARTNFRALQERAAGLTAMDLDSKLMDIPFYPIMIPIPKTSLTVWLSITQCSASVVEFFNGNNIIKYKKDSEREERGIKKGELMHRVGSKNKYEDTAYPR